MVPSSVRVPPVSPLSLGGWGSVSLSEFVSAERPVVMLEQFAKYDNTVINIRNIVFVCFTIFIFPPFNYN